MPPHASAAETVAQASCLLRRLRHPRFALLLVSVLALSGCATPARRPTITLATIGEPAMMCYVHGTDDTAFIDPRIVQVRQLWAVTGNVRTSGTDVADHCRVKVEAVTADESLVLATLSPIRSKSDDAWTFHLPIPAPAVFDHLHLAVVSADEALQTLPPHARRYH